MHLFFFLLIYEWMCFAEKATVLGEVLDLIRISRTEMGAYLCIAQNGVPPSVSKRIILTVECEFFFLILVQVEEDICQLLWFRLKFFMSAVSRESFFLFSQLRCLTCEDERPRRRLFS